MSLSVRIPKEIYDYEEKILMNLSWKKLLGVSISVAYSLTIGFIGAYNEWDTLLVMILIGIVVIPIILTVWYKRSGFTFLEWLMLYFNHLYKRQRFYYDNSNNLYISQFLKKEEKKNVPYRKKRRYRKIRETERFEESEETIEKGTSRTREKTKGTKGIKGYFKYKKEDRN